MTARRSLPPVMRGTAGFARPLALILALALALVLPAGARAQDERRIGGLNPEAEAQQGRVALYARDLAGRLTASGVRYDPAQLTAAHANLPFGARLRVTRPDNRRSVVVTVNDRLRAGGDIILLVSDAAGRRLGLSRPNVVVVRTELVGMTKITPPGKAGARPRPPERAETR